MKRLACPLIILLAVACNSEAPRPQTATTATTPAADARIQRGKQLVSQYGCTVCHVVPNSGAEGGSLGPSLAGVGSRPTISGGAVQNTPANLAQFVQNPASLNPQSSMPPMNMPDPDAADIASFLQTLK